MTTDHRWAGSACEPITSTRTRVAQRNALADFHRGDGERSAGRTCTPPSVRLIMIRKQQDRIGSRMTAAGRWPKLRAATLHRQVVPRAGQRRRRDRSSMRRLKFAAFDAVGIERSRLVAGESVAIALVQVGVDVAQVNREHLPGPAEARRSRWCSRRRGCRRRNCVAGDEP